MGQAVAVRAVEDTVWRRALPWAAGLGVNALMLGAIILSPRPEPAPPPLHVIDLHLIITPPAKVDEIDPVLEAAEPDEPVSPATPQRDETGIEPVTVTGPAQTEAEDDEEDEAGLAPDASAPRALPDYGITALPALRARGSTADALREIFCLTSSGASREAADCPMVPESEAFALLRAATNDDALAPAEFGLGIGLDAAEIRALFDGEGLPLADLSGQSSLADTSQRPTSSADSMRDSLPPRHPDPAFGD